VFRATADAPQRTQNVRGKIAFCSATIARDYTSVALARRESGARGKGKAGQSRGKGFFGVSDEVIIDRAGARLVEFSILRGDGIGEKRGRI